VPPAYAEASPGEVNPVAVVANALWKSPALVATLAATQTNAAVTSANASTVNPDRESVHEYSRSSGLGMFPPSHWDTETPLWASCSTVGHEVEPGSVQIAACTP
jgi:hypothetical protein